MCEPEPHGGQGAGWEPLPAATAPCHGLEVRGRRGRAGGAIPRPPEGRRGGTRPGQPPEAEPGPRARRRAAAERGGVTCGETCGSFSAATDEERGRRGRSCVSTEPTGWAGPTRVGKKWVKNTAEKQSSESQHGQSRGWQAERVWFVKSLLSTYLLHTLGFAS